MKLSRHQERSSKMQNIKILIFKIGDWVKKGIDRPFQIKGNTTAAMCTKRMFKSSSEAEQKIYDKDLKDERDEKSGDS
jgi:hypothetical protein